MEARIKNRIDPAGHQYASDMKGKIKRIDLTRTVYCEPLPSIENMFGTNCFINSIVQMLRLTNIDTNMQLRDYHNIGHLMSILNNNISLSKQDILDVRSTLPEEFSSPGQKDAAEFYQWMINDIYDHRRLITITDPMLSSFLTHGVETTASIRFVNAYTLQMEEIITCDSCNNVIARNITNECMLTVPVQFITLEMNIQTFLHGSLECQCEICNSHTSCRIEKNMLRPPEFLIIHLMRFEFDAEENQVRKLAYDVSFPDLLDDSVLGISYQLIGVVYHIGLEANAGHYMYKHLSYIGCIETYDDSRCYINPSETEFQTKDAYILLYQTCDSYMANRPKQTEIQDKIQSAANIAAKRKLLLRADMTVKSIKKDGDKKERKVKKEKKADAEKTSPNIKKELRTKNRIQTVNDDEVIPQLDINKIIKFIRNHSYICSLYTFDQMHGVKNRSDLERILEQIFFDLFKFHGFEKHLLIILYFDFEESGSISFAGFYFLSAMFRAIDSYDNKTMEEVNENRRLETALSCMFACLSIKYDNIVEDGKRIYQNAVHPRNNSVLTSFMDALDAHISSGSIDDVIPKVQEILGRKSFV